MLVLLKQKVIFFVSRRGRRADAFIIFVTFYREYLTYSPDLLDCVRKCLRAEKPMLRTEIRVCLVVLGSLLLRISSATSQTQPPTPPSREFSFEGDLSAEDGEPLHGVRVALLSFDDTVVVETESDQEGHYILMEVPLPAGHFRLRFSQDGYKPELRGFDVTAASTTEPATLNVILKRIPEAELLHKRGGTIAHIKVFYATDRALDTANNHPVFLGRPSNAGLTYGTCEVTLPPTHQPGTIELPAIWKLEFSPNAEEHVVIERLEVKQLGPFNAELKKSLSASADHNAFVFIHGYNNSFDDAVRRAAQLSFDMKFGGVPIVYSWPSRGRFLGYAADEIEIEHTKENLRAFLKDIAEQSGSSSIYVVAHSMGNRALLSVLMEMASDTNARPLRPFRQIVFAAPDVPRADFQNVTMGLVQRAPHLTLYVSSHDQALLLSERFHQGVIRAGDANGVPVVLPGLDTVDVSGVSFDFLGHAYYGENTSVISDITRLFRNEELPRGLAKKTFATGFYWLLLPQ